MQNVDEQLEERFQRVVAPVSTHRVIDEATRRRGAFRRRRRIGSVLLAVCVMAGTVAGFSALDTVFRGNGESDQPAGPANGALVVEIDESHGADRSVHLELVPLDGSLGERLTPDLDGYFQGFSSAPDGRRIAYAYGNGGAGASLAVLDLTTGEQTVLLRGPVSGPSWSPDGTTIAYYAYGDPPFIGTVAADGSGDETRIPGTEVVGGDPSWSPDGTHITFEEFDVQGGPAVMTVDVATGALRKRAPTDGDTAADPVYTPDGARIDFAVSGGIREVGVDGAGDPALVVGKTPDEWRAAGYPHSPASPAWSPDGTALLYVTRGDVFVDALDGSGPRKVAAGSDAVWLPASTGGPLGTG
jgi:WD40-like Beta Propeller Repeat